MTWTTERIELLKAHFAAGLSCAQIARRIGMTRNAVIGKLNRLGLSRPKQRAAPRQGERWQEGAQRPRPPRSKVLMAVGARAYAVALEAEPAPYASAEVEVLAKDRRCSLLELTPVTCRWPLGDPGSESFRFCGHEQVRGLPYCAAHARLAYRPTAQRYGTGMGPLCR